MQLTEEGVYCSGRGNCTTMTVAASPSTRSAEGSDASLVPGARPEQDAVLGMCKCQYGVPPAALAVSAAKVGSQGVGVLVPLWACASRCPTITP